MIGLLLSVDHYCLRVDAEAEEQRAREKQNSTAAAELQSSAATGSSAVE